MVVKFKINYIYSKMKNYKLSAQCGVTGNKSRVEMMAEDKAQ